MQAEAWETLRHNFGKWLSMLTDPQLYALRDILNAAISQRDAAEAYKRAVVRAVAARAIIDPNA